jgi:hypothetical protein
LSADAGQYDDWSIKAPEKQIKAIMPCYFRKENHVDCFRPNQMYNLTQMNQFPIDEIITRLRKACELWPQPSVSVIARQDRSPFKVLVSCIISLRTRDEVTAAVSKRLFSFADTPGPKRFPG